MIQRYIVEVYISKRLVMRCMKRYSDFEALYEVIRMNFKNIDINLPEFPSKFQVINREESRRNYFEKLLNRILEIYCEKITNETNRRLLSTIYVFMVGEQLKEANSQLFSEKSSLEGSEIVTIKSPRTEEMKESRSKELESDLKRQGHRKV